MAAAKDPSPLKTRAKRGVWNIKKRATFIAELSMTANVSASARAAKMKEAQAYAERRKSDAFRAEWAAALSEGYARLELMMLERAMRALSPAPAKKEGEAAEPIDPAQSKIDEYSNKLAMTLLSAHRVSVRDERGVTPTRAISQINVVGAKERLSLKLDQMHARLTGAAQND